MTSMSTVEVMVRINDAEGAVPGRLTMERELTPVFSERAVKPDLSWEHVDEAGHWHAFGLKRASGDFVDLPTLDARPVKAPCDGSCGGVCEGEGYTRIEYRCRGCRELVTPRFVPDSAPTIVSGPLDWRVEVATFVHPAGMVTARMRAADGGEFFGTALAASSEVSAGGGASTVLLANGPLGVREVALRCTCDLIDMSEPGGEPVFRRGRPNGCRRHRDPEREAAIERAKALARGDVLDEFYATDGAR